MKTIEEKAKAYDKAIEYANYLINERCKEGTNASFYRADLDKMFPELESEDDRIRKVLIELVKCNERNGYKLLNNVPTSSMITWLEKQGEQKPQYMVSVEEKEAVLDEKIRKAIIEFFESQDDNTTYSLVPKKDILAWLEKQGEQKSAWSEEDDTKSKAARVFMILLRENQPF